MRFSGQPRDDGLPGRVQGWRKRLGVEPDEDVVDAFLGAVTG